LSLFGGIQPAKLLSYLTKTVKNIENDGLVQRLQLAVYPDTGKSWKLVDEYPDTDKKNRAFAVIETLATMDFVAAGAHQEDDEAIPFFRFSSEAQEFFYECLRRLETEKLRNSDEESIMVEHLGKFRSLLPSLALVFHLIEVADRTASGSVSLHSLQQAAQWCDYLESHARRIYGLVSNSALQAATRLAAKIKNGSLRDRFTARDVYRKQWGLLEDKDAAQAAINELVAAGWLRQDVQAPRFPGQPGQPPLPTFEINPKVGEPEQYRSDLATEASD
jgi:hypothetical protein